MEQQTYRILQVIQQESESSWSHIASIVSTVSWSLGFYGQLYDNYKLKSVQGFSLDYLTLNFVGYTFYGIYSTIGYFTDIKGAGTVLLGDLIFVYHALPIVIILGIQCLYYPRGQNRISKQAIIIAVTLWVLVILETVFTVLIPLMEWTEYWNPVSALGYSKLAISFIKYTPAVYWNYKRKSTKGWSIFNIISDMIGGVLSLASGSVSVQNGLNVTKLLLAILTIFYDTIFIVQHYILYRKKPEQIESQSSLITAKDKSDNFKDNSVMSEEAPLDSQQQQK